MIYIGACQYRQCRLTMTVLLITTVVACSTTTNVPPVSIASTQTEDGAPAIQIDVSNIPDATPRPVNRTTAGNKSPYTIFGKSYSLLADSQGYQDRGYASWYGTKFHGKRTANGEVYDMWAMTAAHRTLPIPSYLRVTNIHNGRTVTVRVNDRGPFHSDRIIDLSYAAAKKLGYAENGVALVDIVDVTPVAANARNNHAERVTPIAVPATKTTIPATKTTIPATKTTIPTTKTTIPATTSPPPALAPLPSQAAAQVVAPAVAVMPKAQPLSVLSTAPIAPTSLQVGAFRQQASAIKLQAKLSRVLKVPVNVLASQTKPTWYRVRLGPITDKQTLVQTQQLLLEQGIQQFLPIK